MRLKRGLSWIWPYLYRAGLVRPHMPFWRVVVEAKLDRRARSWPARFEYAIAPVYVWARTIEEAEGLAALALEGEGVEALTADAKKCSPAAAPRRTPGAAARGEFGFLPRVDAEAADGPRRDARA